MSAAIQEKKENFRTSRGQPGVRRARHTGKLVRMTVWVPEEIKRTLLGYAEGINSSESSVARTILEQEAPKLGHKKTEKAT